MSGFRPLSQELILNKQCSRLVVLFLRTQSLLNLKLYQMKKHELKDYQKTIQDVLAKSGDDPSGSDQGQSRAEQMSTPSPAGSDGSRVSCNNTSLVSHKT